MLYQKPLAGSTPYAAHIIEMNSFELHRHYEVELIFCLEGAVKATVGGEDFVLNAGELLYVGSFTPHCYDSVENTKVVLVEFGHAFLKDDFFAFAGNKNFVKKFSSSGEVPDEMKKIAQILEDPEKTNRLDLIGELYKLCAALLRDIEPASDTKKLSELERIAPALRLVQMNYMNPITIDDACRETSLSPGNFCTIFKNAAGMGFHSYLNSYRVQNACYLLKQTDMSVDEIAELSGFADMKTFYRVFKKETGSPPKQYRKA